MGKEFLSTVNNFSEDLDNATFGSTIAPPTASKQIVSPLLLASVGLVILGVGTCANSVVLAVLFRARRKFGTNVHTLITNQTAIDLYTCAVGMLTLVMIITGAYKYNRNEILDGAICVLFEGTAFIGVGVTADITGLIVITLERYFKIVHAIAHRKYYRDWMTKLGVALPWIGGVCLVLFPAFGATRIVNGRCLVYGVWINQSMKQVHNTIILQ